MPLCEDGRCARRGQRHSIGRACAFPLLSRSHTTRTDTRGSVECRGGRHQHHARPSPHRVAHSRQRGVRVPRTVACPRLAPGSAPRCVPLREAWDHAKRVPAGMRPASRVAAHAAPFAWAASAADLEAIGSGGILNRSPASSRRDRTATPILCACVCVDFFGLARARAPRTARADPLVRAALASAEAVGPRTPATRPGVAPRARAGAGGDGRGGRARARARARVRWHPAFSAREKKNSGGGRGRNPQSRRRARAAADGAASRRRRCGALEAWGWGRRRSA